MSTGITSENEQFVSEAIQAGSYSSREREEVRRKVQAGIDQAERGELLDGDEVFDRLEARAREIVASAGK